MSFGVSFVGTDMTQHPGTDAAAMAGRANKAFGLLLLAASPGAMLLTNPNPNPNPAAGRLFG